MVNKFTITVPVTITVNQQVCRLLLDEDGIIYELEKFGTALPKKEVEILLGLESRRLSKNSAKAIIIELKR